MLIWYLTEANEPNPVEYMDTIIEVIGSFDLSAGFRHDDSLDYVDINIEINIEESVISARRGGSVFAHGVGTDSYTAWIYSIWNNGHGDTGSV